MSARALAIAAVLLAATPVLSEDASCDVAAGLGTRACTFPEGQVVIETDLIDRTIDRAGGLRTESTQYADTTAHVGLRRGIELQLGWTAYDREHTRLPTGATLRSTGIGDVTVGAKFALVDPLDHPIGVALQPTLSIPTGQLELGAKGLGGSVLLAVSYDLNDALTVELTPRGELLGDRADDDRHWEYGATLGFTWNASDALFASAEYRLLRDEDPVFRRVSNVGALSFGWLPTRAIQLNLGGAFGLDRRSPRLQLIGGIALHLL